MITEERGWVLIMSQSIPVRTRGMQKGRQRILVYATISMIIIGLAAILVSEVTINQERSEYLWIQAYLKGNGTTTGVAILYDENNNFLEEFVIFNTTEWQSSIYSYTERMLINLYVDFWYMEDIVPKIEYKIGRGLITIHTANIIVSVNSFINKP